METIIDIVEIKKLLPHRYPFLLVDKVTQIDDASITAIKNVTINEPFFVGHFPHEPIMPGVLQVEAMAQTAAIWVNKKKGLTSKSSIYFLTIDKVKFRKPVRPGDQLVIKVRVLRHKDNRVSCEACVFVDEQLVSEAVMMAMLQR